MESIYISSGKRQLVCDCNIFSMSDNHNYTMVCIPSLNIYGYGKTEDFAIQMLKCDAESYFEALLSLDNEELDMELRKFGWSCNNSDEGVSILKRSFSDNPVGLYNMPDNTSIKYERFELVA